MSQTPNVIILTSHDTGRHFGCYGVPTVQSPNIDRLAERGVRLTDCFCAAPLCGPSRAAMMSGRYPQSNGVMGQPHFPEFWEYREGVRHSSQLFRDAGYRTLLFGMEHETQRPERLGFDDFRKHWVSRAIDDQPATQFPAAEVGGAVADFLTNEGAGDRPFYLQVGFAETHRPFDRFGTPPDREKGVWVPPYLVDNDAARDDLAGLQGSIRGFDAGVGAVVDALEASGLAENTLLICNVDHGIPFPRAKNTLYDAGMGIACIVRWPGGGIDGGRTCEGLAMNIDMLPTVFDLAGLDVPACLEGVSHAAALRADAPRTTREAVYGWQKNARCIRTDTHKLIRVFEGGRTLNVPVDMNVEKQGWGAWPFVELYDLREDPNEFDNLADDPAHADIRRDLDARLLAHMRRVDDPMLEGPVPTPFYQRAIADFRKATE